MRGIVMRLFAAVLVVVLAASTAAAQTKTAEDYIDSGFDWWIKGDYGKAVKDYSEAIRLDPKNAVAYEGRGLLQGSFGHYDKAISDYRKAIQIDPKHVNSLAGLANIMATCPDAKCRNGKKAVEFASKACDLTGFKYDRLVSTLAAAHAENGDFKQAVKWQEKAIQLREKAVRVSDVDTDYVKAFYYVRLELYKQGKPFREEVKKK